MNDVKIGDIILIDSLTSEGTPLKRHSFVVIEDKNGKVLGLDYDFIALLLSSFKDNEQKKAKLKYPGNFPILNSAENVKGGNKKDGFIKAEQFFYFRKEKTPFRIIGELKPETLSSLMEFISSLPKKKVEIRRIIDNL